MSLRQLLLECLIPPHPSVVPLPHQRYPCLKQSTTLSPRVCFIRHLLFMTSNSKRRRSFLSLTMAICSVGTTLMGRRYRTTTRTITIAQVYLWTQIARMVLCQGFAIQIRGLRELHQCVAARTVRRGTGTATQPETCFRCKQSITHSISHTGFWRFTFRLLNCVSFATKVEHCFPYIWRTSNTAHIDQHQTHHQTSITIAINPIRLSIVRTLVGSQH